MILPTGFALSLCLLLTLIISRCILQKAKQQNSGTHFNWWDVSPLTLRVRAEIFKSMHMNLPTSPFLLTLSLWSSMSLIKPHRMKENGQGERSQRDCCFLISAKIIIWNILVSQSKPCTFFLMQLCADSSFNSSETVKRTIYKPKHYSQTNLGLIPDSSF